MEKYLINSALQRVFEAAECWTQVELALVLGIRQSSISDAKKRNSVPAEQLITLLRLKRVSPEWILSGTGARFLQPVEYSEAYTASLLSGYDIQPLERYSAQELADELARRSSCVCCQRKHRID